jgi:hypothetical protein
MLEIVGVSFNRRVRATAGDNYPGAQADQQAAQYIRDAFQVIHTNALRITRASSH